MKKRLTLFGAALVAALVVFTWPARNPFHKSSREPASSGDRSPASIQRVFDFSNLEGGALQAAAKHRLFNSIDVESSPGSTETSIRMGNFVLLNDKNQKDFACGFYDKLILEFEADGISVDGEKPKLTIEANCQVGENINFMKPIQVPVAKIKSQAPGNSEFKFFQNKEPITFKVSNSAAQWPKHWVLSNVKLTNTKFSSRVLNVRAGDQEAGPHSSVSMNW